MKKPCLMNTESKPETEKKFQTLKILLIVLFPFVGFTTKGAA